MATTTQTPTEYEHQLVDFSQFAYWLGPRREGEEAGYWAVDEMWDTLEILILELQHTDQPLPDSDRHRLGELLDVIHKA